MNNIFSRFFLILVICGLSKNVAAQERQSLYDSVSKLIQEAFNAEDPMKIYTLTSPSYKVRMSAEAFSEGTRKFLIKTGKWNQLIFREESNGGIAYTAVFEREKQVFFLQLDDQGRVLRLNFTPVPFVKGTKNYRVPSSNPLRSNTDSLVERLVRPYIQQGHTAGLCLAIIKNDTVHCYSYGEVEKGSKRLPDPQKTIFEIGSVTKTFTSLLLANEVILKRMSLSDPINKYLPDYIHSLSYNNSAITLEHLANHSSGFPRLPANIYHGKVNPSDPYRHYNEDSLYNFLMLFQTSVMPGSHFSYSNLGAGLLGCILSRATKQNFEQLLIEQICLPLKMIDTRIELGVEDSTLFAQGYNEKGEPTAPWNLAALQGSGAIRSTLNDMVRYTQAQLGQLHSPLDSAILLTHQITFQSMNDIMGLGWRIERQKDHFYWHHSGGTGGFRSFVGFDKKRFIGVIILSNTAEDVTAIGQTILAD